ncbi:MAG: hypothetical protein OXC62_14085 [Aestuariivita sp.]|nr:hypothetical protein [Aestuariivita sp.]
MRLEFDVSDWQTEKNTPLLAHKSDRWICGLKAIESVSQLCGLTCYCYCGSGAIKLGVLAKLWLLTTSRNMVHVSQNSGQMFS